MKKLVRNGRVCGGQVVVPAPLPLDEGADVTVEIKPKRKLGKKSALSSEEFLAMPFFGMWAGRKDMQDSVAWVQKERSKWRQRSPNIPIDASQRVQEAMSLVAAQQQAYGAKISVISAILQARK
jgi:hypothetical protein